MLPVIQFGPLSIQTQGLILLIGLWVGLIVGERLSSRFGINADSLERLVLIPLIAGVIGARIFYVLKSTEMLTSSPLSIFSLNPAMLDREGGILIGVLVLFVYAQRKNIDLWAALDALTPVISVVLITLGLAFLASGEMYGRPTGMPWGINLWGEIRHPTQIYRSVISAGILVMTLILSKEIQKDHARYKPGIIFLLFVGVNAMGIIILETFHGNPNIIIGGISAGQIAAFFILAACVLIIDNKISILKSEDLMS
jgi:phosphatidylglycerol:prolipoprotein diacylglycerol transferase